MKIVVIIETEESLVRLSPVIHSLETLRIDVAIVYVSTHPPTSNFKEIALHLNIRFREMIVIGPSVKAISDHFHILEKSGSLFNCNHILLGETSHLSFYIAYYAYSKNISILSVIPEFSIFPNTHLQLITNLANLIFLPSFAIAKLFLQRGFPKESLCLTGATTIDSISYINAKIHRSLITKASSIFPFLDSYLEKSQFPVLFDPHPDSTLENYLKISEKIITLTNEISNSTCILLIPEKLEQYKETIKRKLSDKRTAVLPRLSFLTNIYLLRNIRLILTNQEIPPIAATTMRVPILFFTMTSHYSELIRSGHARWVNNNDDEIIFQECQRALSFGAIGHSFNPLGDGKASKRIAQKIAGRYSLTLEKNAAVIPFPSRSEKKI